MPRNQQNVLKDMDLRNFIKKGVAISKSDGGGLTFTLSAAGTAAWVLRYRSMGRPVELTLGRYPDITLALARKLAAEKRVELQQGRDPALEKRKAKSREDWTVRKLVADYRLKKLSTLASSTQRSYGRNLKRVEASIGSMMVSDVSAADVVTLIEKSRLGWVEANTLLIVSKEIFRFAAGRKLINTNPVLGIELAAIIGPRPPKKQRLMLSHAELREVMNAAVSRENLLALRILLATGVRASELFQARRSNLFLEEARWHIPSSKTDVGMDIPLPPAVVSWFQELGQLNQHSAFVLPARAASRVDRNGGDAHLGKDTIRESIDYWLDATKCSVRRFTPHDFRSTMKSHMRALNVSNEVSEMCLNHKLPGVVGIYDQYNYYEERREAYERWVDFLLSL